MQHNHIVSQDEWFAAHAQHLAKEKELTRLRDALSAARRELPWVKVEKTYLFDTANGKKTLTELFAGRSQLVVKHFMFGPGWQEGCVGCSFEVDHIEVALVHLEHHDVTSGLGLLSRCEGEPFMSLHPCCATTATAPVRDTIGRRASKGRLQLLICIRWCRDIARWLVPSALFALLPKCPACVAAYVAMGTGVGLSLSTTATQLRMLLVVAGLASLSYLVARRMHHLMTR